VDDYLLQVHEAGQTYVITTGNTVYYHRDAQGQPIGDPVHYASFSGLSPQETYTLRLAARDLDSGRVAWSDEHAFTVPLGDFWLAAQQASLAGQAGTIVTATLLLTMTENLFSDVHISLDTYYLPPGFSLSGIAYEPATGAGGAAHAPSWESVPAPVRLPPGLRASPEDQGPHSTTTLLVRAGVTVPAGVAAASYNLPFVGHSGELERQAEVTLQVGAPQEVVVDPGATQPVVLQGSLPLPSCATAIDVTIPPGAFAVPAVVGFRQGSSNVEDWGGMRFAGSSFSLSARDNGTSAPIQPVSSLSVDLHYDPACLGGLRENSLHLWRWTAGAVWTTAGVACTPDPAQALVRCDASRVGRFALFESAPEYLYLPCIMKP
jgi:hypothetical protein